MDSLNRIEDRRESGGLGPASAWELAVDVVHTSSKEVAWIRMLATRLQGRDRLSGKTKRDLDVICQLSEAAVERMRECLAAARDEYVSPGPRALRQVVQRATLEVSRRSPGVQIVSNLEGKGLGRLLVASSVLSALVAIIENAADFSEPGGRVDVVVGVQGSLVRVDVRDSGRGMAEAVLKRCRAAGFTTRAGCGGSGLGLACAARVMGEVGGRLEIESRVGVGTVASLVIPVDREQRGA